MWLLGNMTLQTLCVNFCSFSNMLSFLNLNQTTGLRPMGQELDLFISHNLTVMAVKQNYWTVKHWPVQLVYTIVTTWMILGCSVKVIQIHESQVMHHSNSLLSYFSNVFLQ